MRRENIIIDVKVWPDMSYQIRWDARSSFWRWVVKRFVHINVTIELKKAGDAN